MTAGSGSERQGLGVEALEEALGHRFEAPDLLDLALAHPSWAHEVGDGHSNERLEFLGDAVLDLVVSRLLYDTHPTWPEGELTRTRASLVNRDALAECARALSLGEAVKLGRTEQRSGGAEKPSILADCFEAVIGALYLDAGLEPVERITRRLFDDALFRGAAVDPKTRFQEWAHARYRQTPTYSTQGDSGTENDALRFTARVSLRGELWGEGRGRTKRAAERGAAEAALERVPRVEQDD